MNKKSFENIKNLLIEVLKLEEDIDIDFLIGLLECELIDNPIEQKIKSLKELIELEVKRFA